MKARPFAATTLALCLVPLALGSPGARAAAQEPPDSQDPAYPGDAAPADLDAGESPERYAQVKVVEGEVTIHKGDADETLTRGIPVAEGDVVESHGRGVLQLGDGSALAFGADTRFKVAALFAQQDEERRVLITLERGELRIRKGLQSDAVLRVDTPSGTGTLGNRGNAPTRPDATFQVGGDGRVVFLVHGGQATFGNEHGQSQVFAGQRLTVYGPQDGLNRVSDFNAFSLDAFDQWSEDLVRPRVSESASRVPPEIRYYADDLDTTGRWVYVDDCSSWCWTPTVVAADWRPYAAGYWGCYGGGMTWVSSEPWGYVTYHHGRWGWRMGLGWYWIPGIAYSPAWVAWHSGGGYFGWAPLGYYNRPCHWGYGAWGGGPCWNVVNINYVGRRDLHAYYHADPVVFRTFNAAPAGGGHPWFAGRVIVDRREIANPVVFQRVVSQPAVVRERLVTYDRREQAATGRPILRPMPPAGPNRGPVAFHEVERPTTQPLAPVFRPGPAGPGGRPVQPAPSQGGNPRPFPPPAQGGSFPGPAPRGGQPQPTPPAPRQDRVPSPGLQPVQPARPVQPAPQAPPPPARRTPADERPRFEPSPAPERPRQEPRREEPRREEPRREEPRREPRPEPKQEAPRERSESKPKDKK